MKDIRSYNLDEYDYRENINELLKENKRIKEEGQKKLQEQQYQTEYYKTKLEGITNSRLYKLSKPLRYLRRLLRKLNLNQSGYIRLIQDKKEDENTRKGYNSTYQKDRNFSKYQTDIKALAFYLPQYHEFKENNEWWGKGFMEWTNTKKSVPRFEGHYQPRVPHKDIGYYTLDNVETIKKQVEMAKKHGIYGFCFYYYWFSGKRLMEKPGDLFLEDKTIDFPFCLCWANENWTRTWDGQETDILIKQDYNKHDQSQFIKDAQKYLEDPRYIRIDGKPLIMIYNPYGITNFEKMIKEWRKTAKNIGIGDICIWCKVNFADEEHKYTRIVDGEFDFPPHGVGHEATKIYGLPSSKIFDYGKIVDDIEHIYREYYPLKPFYHTCTMGWDNSARRQEEYTIYYNYSLEKYYKWLRVIIEETRKRNQEDKRFILINAWNEWAEGTYLEPDEKYGYANINTLSKAIFDLPFEEKKKSTKKTNEG